MIKVRHSDYIVYVSTQNHGTLCHHPSRFNGSAFERTSFPWLLSRLPIRNSHAEIHKHRSTRWAATSVQTKDRRNVQRSTYSASRRVLYSVVILRCSMPLPVTCSNMENSPSMFCLNSTTSTDVWFRVCNSHVILRNPSSVVSQFI